jgi:hypothetical protein
MSIKFDVVERGRLGHADTPKKYYPSIGSLCGDFMKCPAGHHDVLENRSRSPDQIV